MQIQSDAFESCTQPVLQIFFQEFRTEIQMFGTPCLGRNPQAQTMQLQLVR